MNSFEKFNDSYNENSLEFLRLTFQEEGFEWNKYSIRNLLIFSKIPIDADKVEVY